MLRISRQVVFTGHSPTQKLFNLFAIAVSLVFALLLAYFLD